MIVHMNYQLVADYDELCSCFSTWCCSSPKKWYTTM